MRGCHQQRQRHHDRGRHGIKPLEPRHHRPGQHHRQGEHRHVRDRAHRREAETEQHTGQHGVGQCRRDGADRAAERAPQPGHHDQRIGQQERAHSRRKPAGDGAGAGQQRRTRRGPCHADRLARAQAQHHPADPHRQRQRHQPGCGLRLGRPHRGQPAQDDGERTGKADNRGKQPGADRLR
jgi:hypothetical protein